ncbi:unnamed protein product, partial [Tuber aestivum]
MAIGRAVARLGLPVARWTQPRGTMRVNGVDNVTERIDPANEKPEIGIADFLDTVKGVVDEIHEVDQHGANCATDAARFRHT